MKRLLLAILLMLLGAAARAQTIVPVVGGVATIDVSRYSNFKVFVNQNISSLSFSAVQTPVGGAIIYLIFQQNATGGWTVTFTGNIVNACTVSTTASTTTVCQFQYDVTNSTWYGVNSSSGGGGGGGNVSGTGAPVLIPIWTGTSTQSTSLLSESSGTLNVGDPNGLSTSTVTTTGPGPYRFGGANGALGSCTTPASGFTYYCNVTGVGLELSYNGGAYAPVGPGNNPGGSNTQIQFNDSGSFNGNSGLVYNKATNSLTATATATGQQNLIAGPGGNNALNLTPTFAGLSAEEVGSQMGLGANGNVTLESNNGNVNITFPNGGLFLGANAQMSASGQLTVLGCTGCGGGGTITAESLGAAPSATAAVNTAAIQNALTTFFPYGGTVTLATCGTYLINGTLNIGSGTTFSLAPCVTIFLASGSNVTMLENYAAKAAIYNVNPTVTLSWTSGITFNVAWTGHGLVLGDYVYLQGANQGQYNGIFKVTTVIDANNFTVTAMRVPSTAPTGTIKAIKADVNIHVEGGTWNYNQAGNPGGGGTNTDAIILGVADHASMRNMGCLNALKYCFEFGAVVNPTSENLWSINTNSDTLKVYGPAYHGSFRNTTGFGSDDVVSFHPHEGNAQFWTYGDCIDLVADGINADSTTNAFILYPDNIQVMQGVGARNIIGTAGAGVAVLSGTSGGTVDSMFADNVGPFTPTGNGTFNFGGNGNALTINKASFNGVNIDTNYATAVFYQNASVTINQISIRNAESNSTTWGAPSNYFYNMGGTGTLVDLDIRNSTFKGAGAVRLVSICTTCAVNGITVDNVAMPGATTDKAIALLAGSTGNPQIQILNSQLGGAQVLDLRANSNVSLFGNVFASATSGVLNLTGSITVNVTGSGNTLTSGKWIVIASGTPTINDNLLTGTGSTQAACRAYTLGNNGTNWTVTYNHGTAVAGIAIPGATTSAPVLFALPNRAKINSIFTRTTTAWAGTGFTTVGLTIGSSTGSTTQYTSTPYELTTAVSISNYQDAMPGFSVTGNNVPLLTSSSGYGGGNVLAELTANQNLNANTLTGATDIIVCWQALP